MAGLGTDATTAIITGGLYGGRADQGLITTRFHLYPFNISIDIANHTSTGGSIPMAPGKIANFYTPVPQQYYPTNNPTHYLPGNESGHTFIVTITINGHDTTFGVRRRTGATAVKVLNLANAGKDKIKIAINNLKLSRLRVIVSNIKKNIFK